MSFPPADRGARLLLTRASRARLRRNLKLMPCSTQYSHTASTTRAASSAVAEAWIFQPCSGSRASPCRRTTQPPRSARRQPAGAGCAARAKRLALSSTRSSVSAKKGSATRCP